MDEKKSDLDQSPPPLNKEISELARRLTNNSLGTPGSLFPLHPDSTLDPNSTNFNPKAWAKAFFQLRTHHSEGNPPRTTGLSWTNLDAYGFGSTTSFQKSVGNVFFNSFNVLNGLFHRKQLRVDILHSLDGVVKSGEMLLVLGPPGSGCSSFLRTVAGDTYGFHVSANINYSGITPKEMGAVFRGEAIYTAEVDNHFAHLSVGDTLYFAARVRGPKNIPEGVSRKEYAEHLRDVIMAMFGISHTKNTRVGNQYIRGVSGGERKRVTIAEAALSYAPLQCWDNSTRGLDSANAIEFCRNLRTQADIMGITSCVALYQAPQSAYELFDKVLLLYEGRQIFFGKTIEAKRYFEELSFICPKQQTTADFLTSMTNASERVIKPGWETRTPRSSDEFAQIWKESRHRLKLVADIEAFNKEHRFGGEHYEKFSNSRRIDQSKSLRKKSPFTLSYWSQMSLTAWRSFTLLKSDPSVTLAMLMLNVFEALMLSSVIYNLPANTSAFFRRGVLLFMVVLLNAFSSILEIITLYEKRRIIEKHSRYAFYHPSAEALSGIMVDLPYKFMNATIVNVTIYFMGNLRREPGAFFFFFLFSIVTMFLMSMMFPMGPASVILLVTVLFSGFAIPAQYMLSWIGWTRLLNLVYYSMESVFLNEFVGLQFACSAFIPSGPGYESVSGPQRACLTTGSRPGEDYVNGTAFVEVSFCFINSNRWRNFGILLAFFVLFLVAHLVGVEYVSGERSKGEVLVCTRDALRKRSKRLLGDVESAKVASPSMKNTSECDESNISIGNSTSVFNWHDLCYDIPVKGGTRRILDHVDGWVKPGTLTALMVSKTTLLDVLASRIDGKQRDQSFQQRTGYVQQQDLHLATSTVREALEFSAVLRQPSRYSRKEKLEYVDEVIKLLDMEQYSDAITGVPGEGLNVEQRKRLTIGVELAARPDLLLFLDEPTSGLDSQTSWSIANLMEKLTRSGQAVLCTIHQPSAMLFHRFDRLLLLAKGGRTVYFGEIGKNATILKDYFVRNGAPDCAPGANPAEYMLEIIGAAPGAQTNIDWPTLWRQTPEYQQIQTELATLGSANYPRDDEMPGTASVYKEFATPIRAQFMEVLVRVGVQYWRSPSYIYSKALLSVGAALLIGLSFVNAENTSRGLENQMFGVLMFLFVFSQIQSFLAANIVVETAWNSLMAVFSFVAWYFPIGLYRNAYPTDAVNSRGIAVFLHVWMFFVFASTFAYLIIAGLESQEVGGVILTILFIMMYIFCGILTSPTELPGFWQFMYRVNPLTYIVEGFLGTSLANAPMRCAPEEIIRFQSPNRSTCGEYLQRYIDSNGGAVLNPDVSGAQCEFCPITTTNTYLQSLHVSFSNRWRDFGLLMVYCVFNVVAAFVLYWLARVSNTKKSKRTKTFKKSLRI
ncbi:hypothetical protein EJ08DRAFT_673206 [Tothia fuscella]|uniref:ABC transporter domain-containing protein n=1 Tax=Tothia fuscella TaxID=1048955 RepID=A0A9P4NGB3_9PEZI|nr:hypothetical protein EJ08DRAFT_673206 [Tothia fuscella]